MTGNREVPSGALASVLIKLIKTGGIDSAVVAKRDGVLLALTGLLEQKEESFAAMTATSFGAAEEACAILGIGVSARLIMETDSAKVLVVSAGSKALLAVIVEIDAGLGLILLEMQKAAEKIKQILE